MRFPMIDELRQLEALRKSRVIIYFGEDRPPFAKAIEEDDILALYECLRYLGPTERLDLLLHMYGGRVNASRKITLLLRDFAPQLHVLVPYKARSAGTVICLGADQIVMGPLAELSPIDPQIVSMSEPSGGGPALMSSEDVIAFRQMAEAWFGLQSEDHRMQVFGLLSQRFFPTSLSTFFRADRQIRQIADELLQFQLPQSDQDTRQRIVNQLVSGYHAHDYSITRSEAGQLGLRVAFASAEEEALLWKLWCASREYLNTARLQPEQPGVDERIDGMIVSTNFHAVHVVRRVEQPFAGGAQPGGQVQRPVRMMAETRWQILYSNEES